MAYTRRGFLGGARQTTLVGDISAGATTIPGADLSTWAGLTSNGPGTATINVGQADEETITFTGISGNNLTTVTRGAAGTTAQQHTSGATIEHTSSKVDFDEANAHIADTTLDHHTQYYNVTRGDARYGRLGSANTFSALQTVSAGGVNVTGGQVQSVGTENTFGAGAFGAAAAHVSVGNSGATAIVAAGHGTLADASIVVKPKGSGATQLKTGLDVVGVDVRSGGSVMLGPGVAVATNAVNGFVGVTFMAGTPSGVPDLGTGSVVYDTSANKLWVYNGSWRSVAVA